jgi:hypothetical protein
LLSPKLSLSPFGKFHWNYTGTSTVLEGGIKVWGSVPFARRSLQGTFMLGINFRVLILNGTEEAELPVRGGPKFPPSSPILPTAPPNLPLALPYLSFETKIIVA